MKIRRKQPRPLQQEPATKLSEVGSRLRQARLEQSLSLEDVAAITKIQRRMLEAIEAGRKDQLPEPVYIQGFIKRFAEALGVDEPEISGTFSTEFGLRSVKNSWRTLPAAQLRPIHLYLLYVFLILGAVNG
ncbi:MAG: helix-turn-helix domain-containing protein, partial [Leptolyngbyaceae bacterium]|nr:helix-turn-helix domain-containing protein [Leptolyngbyaceae bacterium]